MGLVHGNFQTSSNIAARCDIHVAGPFPLNSRSAERARSVPGLSLDISGSALLDYQHLLYVVLATAMYGLQPGSVGLFRLAILGFQLRCSLCPRRTKTSSVPGFSAVDMSPSCTACDLKATWAAWVGLTGYAAGESWGGG